MKKIVLNVLLALSILTAHVIPAVAGELDILVDKLVEKGILSPAEAKVILDETREQVAKEISEAKSPSLPKWVQNTSIEQDFRLSYQYKRKNSDTESRSTGRVRYRLGVETKIADQLKTGVGLTTGGSDARATNETFDGTFSTPDIRLNYAYAEYAPVEDLKVIGGKFKREPYLWAPTDLLWDGDINPEGGSLHFGKNLDQNTDVFFNTGVWVLEENGASDRPDPFMHYAQLGAKWNDDNFDMKLAGIYYGFNGVQGTALTGTQSTNTLDTTVLKYDYDSIGVSLEFGLNDPFEYVSVKRAAIFGDYINNVSTGVEQNIGWAAGIKFGDKKVKNKGQWQAKYTYANLGKDAFPDVFPDSDRYSGKTDVRSHETAFSYGVKNNVIFGIDYYYSDPIKSASNKEQLVQGDILLKF